MKITGSLLRKIIKEEIERVEMSDEGQEQGETPEQINKWFNSHFEELAKNFSVKRYFPGDNKPIPSKGDDFGMFYVDTQGKVQKGSNQSTIRLIQDTRIIAKYQFKNGQMTDEDILRADKKFTITPKTFGGDSSYSQDIAVSPDRKTLYVYT